MSVLHLAAKLDQLEIVKFVIDNVEDKNPIVPTTKGFTILHMLAYDQGHVEVVDAILKQLEKGKRNPYDGNGNSPAHIATLYDNIELMKLFVADLVDKNPPVNSESGRTLLHFAAWSGKVYFLEYLYPFVDDLNPGLYIYILHYVIQLPYDAIFSQFLALWVKFQHGIIPIQ